MRYIHTYFHMSFKLYYSYFNTLFQEHLPLCETKSKQALKERNRELREALEQQLAEGVHADFVSQAGNPEVCNSQVQETIVFTAIVFLFLFVG